MSGSDLTAGTWDITRTRGDIMVPDEFVLELNGSPWVVESVKAQVRVDLPHRLIGINPPCNRNHQQ